MIKFCLVTALAVIVLALACRKEADDPAPAPPGTFYGTVVSIGNGEGRSFIANVNDQEHLQLGITLDAAALEGLPDGETHFEFDLPEAARELTPFDHISLGWMSHGHPEPVYHTPHFDVQFYMISRPEKEAIVSGSPEMNVLPASAFMPVTYFSPETAGVSRMGRHWLDINSPELMPGGPPFTTTMVMGSYNGKVVFWEPMITRDYLLTVPDTTMHIQQPLSFEKQGHYPTDYSIRFDAQQQQYTIYLSGFANRKS